jgi:hypothetical protein
VLSYSAPSFLHLLFRKLHLPAQAHRARPFPKVYGLANVEWTVPNSPTTEFRIGSLTKQFTATAIMGGSALGAVALGQQSKAQ